MEKIKLQNYESMINKAVWKTHKSWCASGIEFEELKSQAYLVFCEALKRFDESKNIKFSTFLTWRLRTLNDYAAYNSRRTAYLPDTFEGQDETNEDVYFQQSVERLELKNASVTLSENARELLNELLSGTFHFVDMKSKKPKLHQAKKIMKTKGWENAKTEQAWNQIATWWKFF